MPNTVRPVTDDVSSIVVASPSRVKSATVIWALGAIAAKYRSPSKVIDGTLSTVPLAHPATSATASSQLRSSDGRQL